jgi:hypothetical protein
MRVVRAGSAIAFIFRKKALPVVFYTVLLALAFAGVVLVRGQQLAAAGSPPTQDSTQRGEHAGASAEGNGPDQQIGQLYQMATDLKAEVTKTDQNVLSINVVRKATAIEQLAHRMRTGGGGR